MTNQQNLVLVALTRTHMPRTVRNISVETGVPEPSVRRTIMELRTRGWDITVNRDTRKFRNTFDGIPEYQLQPRKLGV